MRFSIKNRLRFSLRFYIFQGPRVTRVQLLGLDFGTTTSSAVIGAADLVRNAVTGRTELSRLTEVFRRWLAISGRGSLACRSG